MGGSVFRRRMGRIIRLGSTMPDEMLPASEAGPAATGCFSEAAVAGLRSCLGEGFLLTVEDWRTSGICSAGSVIVNEDVVGLTCTWCMSNAGLRVELPPESLSARLVFCRTPPSSHLLSLLVPFSPPHSFLHTDIVAMAAAQGYPLLCLENPLLGMSMQFLAEFGSRSLTCLQTSRLVGMDRYPGIRQ